MKNPVKKVNIGGFRKAKKAVFMGQGFLTYT